MGKNWRAAVVQARRLSRKKRVVLPTVGEAETGFISAACDPGHSRHFACFSLRCTCECHRRCVPKGDDHRCKKVGSCCQS